MNVMCLQGGSWVYVIAFQHSEQKEKLKRLSALSKQNYILGLGEKDEKQKERLKCFCSEEWNCGLEVKKRYIRNKQ